MGPFVLTTSTLMAAKADRPPPSVAMASKLKVGVTEALRRDLSRKTPVVGLILKLWCGVVWCGVVWCGVVWCGVVWCGAVWCNVVWCGVVL